MPIKKKPIITIGIIGINVLVFIWLSLFGMTEDAVLYVRKRCNVCSTCFGKSRILPINNQYVFRILVFHI